MFSSTPFKKAVVGRVVEVNVHGAEDNENQNRGNNNIISNHHYQNFKESTPVRKSSKRSVSKLFSSSKKSSISRTPGRKLFKRLICTPGKARSLPDTSLSEVDDFGVAISHNRSDSSRLGIYPSFSSDETAGRMTSSPPKLDRKPYASHSFDMNEGSMTSPTREQNHSSPGSIGRNKSVDEALVAASNNSDRSEHEIFLTNSYSSDESEQQNESNADTMSRLAPSQYASPPQAQRHATSPNVGHNAMRSPGLAIPTPAIAKLRQPTTGTFMDGYSSGPGLQFPHPLRDVPDSPMEDANAMATNPKNLSIQFEEDEDDDAFLPDDFKATSNTAKQEVQTFTLKEVEQKITDARREERHQMRKQHEKVFKEKFDEYEQMLIDSGRQWKRDSDEQEARFKKILKEEKHRTSQKHHELINKMQALESVQSTLKETEEERDSLIYRVDELLTREEANALEKESTKVKTAELSEKLRVLTESSDDSQKQLKEAMEEIALLKGQLAESPSVDPEEIRTSKLEVENLRSLRAEDAKEIEALQDQLSRIVREHQDMCSPKKKPDASSEDESPCVGEIDMLRVDYNRAQDQLKSMGSILKRYKSQRDEYKAKVQELEQRHVQVIEIAVKQATQDQKEKIQLLTRENETLREQSKDTIDKAATEMKKQTEELQKQYEDELSQLRQTLDNANGSAEKQQEMLKAQVEVEKKELIMIHEKKVELMTEYNEALRTKQEEEIESLRSSLNRMKLDFESERDTIATSKSKEFEYLEDQIKSMHEMHNEELELLRNESREEANSSKKKIEELQKELDARPANAISEEVVEGIKSKFEETLQEVKGKAKADRDRLQAEVDSLKEAKGNEATRVNQLEAQIGEIQAQHAARIEQDKVEYNRQIVELKASHGSESDELLAQLDLIEAEINERCKTAENDIREKDAVITALGSQLAESEARSAKTAKQFESFKNEIESLRSDLELARASNDVCRKEINDLIEKHTEEIDHQIELREIACNEAREETIALAEEQLAQRNEYYQALKRELDNAQSKMSVLERDLRFTKKELEERDRRYEAREADLRDELAQSKAVLAKKEANLIRVEKVHQVDLDRLRDAEKAIKAKFEEAQATGLSLQKTLAATLKEKQRIEQECADITAISEELATMLEQSKNSI